MGAGGRPSMYKSEYDEQAYKLCLLGATDEDLARFFGVSTQTIGNWKRSHPGFIAALKSGKMAADSEVANRLFMRAIGYSHPAVKIFNDNGNPLVVDYTEHYPPDTTACIFWLKNRRRTDWRGDMQRDQQAETSGDALANALITLADKLNV